MRNELERKDLEDVLDPDEDIHETELSQERKAELREQRKKRRKQVEGTDIDEEEEDGWEQELRFRRELAANNIKIGIERRRERKARAEANGELTLLQRIRQDANEILKRQQEEKNNARETQAREKKNRDSASSEEGKASEPDSVGDAGSMALLAGKRDKVHVPRSKGNAEDELSTKEVAENEVPFELLAGTQEKKNKEGKEEKETEEEEEEEGEEEETARSMLDDDEDESEDSRDLLTGKRRFSSTNPRFRVVSRVKRTLEVTDGEPSEENQPQKPLSEAEAAILRFRRAAQSGELYQPKEEKGRKKRSKGRNTPRLSRKEREEYYRSIGLPLLSVPDT
nr:hypothetical protein BaRGS_026225 [Batillaria attramentaria]